MRIPQHPRSRRYGFNMTPMIDVIFLLIIFFLVSSHLARQETQIPLPLPTAQTGDAEQVTTQPRITVNIDDQGALTLAGRAVTIDELTARMATARQNDEHVEVRLRSSRHAPYRHIEPVLMACVRAGIWNVSFAVFREEDR